MHVDTSKLQNSFFVNFCAINQIVDVHNTWLTTIRLLYITCG